MGKLTSQVDKIENNEIKTHYDNRERDRLIRETRRDFRKFDYKFEKQITLLINRVNTLEGTAISNLNVSKWTILRDFVNKKEFIYIFGVLVLFFGMTLLMLELMNQSNGGFVVKAIQHFWK